MDLNVTDAGEGTPVVLLHGLTATHRYVVMGSRTLERSGHRVIAYDARGHGASDPAPDGVYDYAALAADLLGVMDDARHRPRRPRGRLDGRPHRSCRSRWRRPSGCAGLVVITPAYDPVDSASPETLARWDALADGLRAGRGGGLRRRLRRRDRPGGVARDDHDRPAPAPERARASPRRSPTRIRGVPRSQPFDTLHDLARVEAPTVVVADRDEADPGHPLSVGEAYAELIPGAELVVEEPGRSPIAWQGGQLSKVIAGRRGARGLSGRD